MTPDRTGEGWLARFALDRRITVLVLFLTTIVVGWVAARRIPVELIPRGYQSPQLAIFAPWENAPSREVLDKITLPLEEELSTVRGLGNVVSISRIGMSQVFLQFKQGTDMDLAYREVRDRIERAKNRFPEGIERVFIHKDDASGIPVYVLGLAVDPGLSDSYNLIQNQIVKPLSRLDGVASVEVQGLVEKEILIELDREKTAAAGLNIFELAQDLGDDNFTLGSGTVRDGSRKLLLRSMARYPDLQALENRFVSDSVRLKDVGRVSYEEPDTEFRVRAQSKPAVAAVVLKEGEANVEEVSRAVAEQIERFKQDPRLSSLEMVKLFSQGEVIHESLSTLLNAGILGGVIAAFVLFIFLGRIRLTVILNLSIPVSALIGLTVMYFAGETLNLVSLLGLIVCIGNLVDNSIVVADNIQRLHQEGRGRREACVRGASEVALAVTLSTLTGIVVFLPVALVEGPGQFFLLRLAIPICVSMTASLVVALVFAPLCVYMTLPVGEAGSGRPWIQRVQSLSIAATGWTYDKTFGRLGRLYNHWLEFFLERRFDLVLSIVGIFALTWLIPMAGVFGNGVEFVQVQEEERSGFHVTVQMPETTTLEETAEWFLAAEKVVEGKREELGLAGWFLFHRKTQGELQGWFNRPRTSDIGPAEATRIVTDALPKKPGMKLTVGEEQEGKDVKDESVYTIVLNGDDPELLDSVKTGLEDVLSRVEGVLGVRGGEEAAPNELGLVIDRERAQRLGVVPQHLAGVVGTALMGMELPKYRGDDKEIPVRVRFREQDRESLTELADFLVPTSRGELLPLSAVTDATFLPTPETYVRRDKQSARTIAVELEKGREKETRKRLEAISAAIDLPEGLSFGDDVRESFQADLGGMFVALGLSVVFVYLLMGLLFESFILPLSILLTIPLSIVGVYWTHFVTGRDIDFLGVVAIVLLVGVVVNNGIMLIDCVNQLRGEGLGRKEALLLGTARRFRPIMMTALTTILGLLPMIFTGANSIGLSYTSFNLTLIGGMTTATLLTLLVVPVFYIFFDDAREAFRVAARRAVQRQMVPTTGIPQQPTIPGESLSVE